MNIKKPIIIIGTGRSGSTMFHEIMCQHPNLSWFSVLLSKYPKRTKLNRFFLKISDLPIIGKLLKQKIIPSETYNYWETYAKGFSKPFRDLYKDDLSLKTKQQIPEVFKGNLTKKRNRLLIKITGWNRVAYLKAIFPDALFIHIKRDPRAVANSFMNVYFWKGWEGQTHWRWGEIPKKYQIEYQQSNASFAALAAIGYKIIDDALITAKKELNSKNFLEITYEDICKNPLKEFNKAIEFAQISKSKPFEKYIMKQKIKNKNYKWKEELNTNQKEILNKLLKDRI